MIVCPRCSKENQDHYKFCLGCGAELPRDAAHAPKSFTAPTPAAGVPSVPAGGGGFGAPAPRPAGGGFGTPAAAAFGAPPAPGSFGAPAPSGGFGAPAPSGGFGAPAPLGGFGAPAGGFGGGPAPMPQPASASMAQPASGSPAGAELKCTNCGSMNNPSFKFCGTCGAPMGAASQPAMPAAQPAAPAAPVGGQRGTLVLIRADGSEGDSFPLGQRTEVGREAGGLFASDSYLSPRHATFTFGASGLTVEDQSSLNGVYLRIASDSPQEVRDRSIFRIGQEIIRFERLAAPPMKDGVELMGSPSAGTIGRICLIIGRETNGNCYAIPAGGLHLGRERGDILFPDDGYVSGLHCRLHEEAGRLMITDVGSSNGTFLRILAPSNVPSGSMLLLGQQLFRAEF